jgi:hypothetical protein
MGRLVALVPAFAGGSSREGGDNIVWGASVLMGGIF